MTRQLAGIVAAAILAVVTGSARADDQEKFQGAWKPEKAVRGGMEMPADELAKMSIEFKGNKAKPRQGDKAEPEAEFTLDGSKNPKTIDVKHPNGETAAGIYEFDGDTLKICFSKSGGARPTKFESPAGSMIMYIVLKRQAK